MNLIKCANNHPIAYLYKELLPEGKGRIICDFQGCDWKSEIFDRHEDIKIDTMAEKKKIFNE